MPDSDRCSVTAADALFLKRKSASVTSAAESHAMTVVAGSAATWRTKMPDAEPNELERALATLDLYANGADAYCQVSQEAARLLRAMARDFDEYADHGLDSRGGNCRADSSSCTCGLNAARARWRIER